MTLEAIYIVHTKYQSTKKSPILLFVNDNFRTRIVQNNRSFHACVLQFSKLLGQIMLYNYIYAAPAVGTILMCGWIFNIDYVHLPL